jgi:hypothetical protein
MTMITTIAAVTVTIVTGNIGVARVTVAHVMVEIGAMVTVVGINAIETAADMDDFATVIKVAIAETVGIEKESCHAQT